MLRLIISLTALLGSALIVNAQSKTAQTILLWPKGAPGAQGTADEDKPTLTTYPVSENRVETGVIVCPGGGYAHLSMEHEGSDIAQWLNHLGIPAFVLKYRLGPKYHHPVELGDAQRAIRYVRAHAAEYGINPQRIGIWGFSAGGHLAATAETHFDPGQKSSSDPIERQSSRPDFAILSYPVITMRDPYAHRGSRQNLLGANPSAHLLDLLSNELQVTPKTPPTFLFHTSDDPVVPVQNSIEFYLALRKANVPAEMHIYQHGKHGVGLAADDPALASWPTLLSNWMKTRGLR